MENAKEILEQVENTESAINKLAAAFKAGVLTEIEFTETVKKLTAELEEIKKDVAELKTVKPATTPDLNIEAKIEEFQSQLALVARQLDVNENVMTLISRNEAVTILVAIINAFLGVRQSKEENKIPDEEIAAIQIQLNNIQESNNALYATIQKDLGVEVPEETPAKPAEEEKVPEEKPKKAATPKKTTTSRKRTTKPKVEEASKEEK